MGEPDALSLSNRDVLERWVEIVNSNEFDKLEEVLDPAYVQEIPQSGELVRGIENTRQIFLNFPGGWQLARAELARVAGSESHYVMTPTFNLVKVEGTGDTLTACAKVRYPDGSDWYIVSFITFKNHKILKRTDYFASLFEPPPWRARWVERMEA